MQISVSSCHEESKLFAHSVGSFEYIWYSVAENEKGWSSRLSSSAEF
jgi:hypothetical protein